MDSRTPTRATERALPPGTLLQRFEIVRVLAERASGIDYLAVDRQRDSEVVVKEYFPQRLARRASSLTMVPRAADDTEPLSHGLQAFLDEAQLLARLEEPSLVHVTGVIEANGTAYQMLPQQGGVSLLEVRKEMRLPPDERSVRALIDALLGALQALHEAGVVHGSVAPANILLLANDRPLLLGPDYARAQTTNELIESLMASVEPAFGAPEQRQPAPDQPLGPWTDLYGLAATMRYFIGGELPPAVHELPPEGVHETMAEMVQRLAGGADAPRYSAALLNALDAALGHVPGARPRSVAAFRGSLGTLPRREGRRAPPQPAPTPAPPPVMAAPPSVAPALDSVPGMLASRFIEPDPEPDDADIDRIVTRAGGRGHDRHRPDLPRRRARWIGATFVLALAAAGAGGWWAMHDAPLLMPPTSAGPTVAPPVADAAPEPLTPRSSAAQPSPPQPAAPRIAKPVQPEAPAALVNPREACSGRTQFSLYRCMQAQCAQARWSEHPQCIRLRATDSVD